MSSQNIVWIQTDKAELNDFTAEFIVSPVEYSKYNYILNLSKKFHEIYWVEPKFADANIFTEILIDKIVKEKKLNIKFKQMLYASYEAIDNIYLVQKAIAEYLLKSKEKTLLIIEIDHFLNDLSVYLDFICLLSKYENNLVKVVFTYNNYLSLDAFYFENNCIMFVDKSILKKIDLKSEITEFVNKLSSKSKAYLIYAAKLPILNKEILQEFWEDGVDILETLSKNTSLITFIDGVYKIEPCFKNYLMAYENENLAKLEPIQANIELEKYFMCSYKQVKWRELFLFYNKNNDTKSMVLLINQLINQNGFLNELLNFIRIKLITCEDAMLNDPLFSFCHVLVGCEKHENEKSTKCLKECLQTLKNRLSMDVYFVLLIKYLKVFYKDNGYIALEEEIEFFQKLCDFSEDDANVLRVLLVKKREELSVSFADLEKILKKETYQSQIFYMQLLENIALNFLFNEYTKESLQVLSMIKEYFPLYFTPPQFAILYYHLGEIQKLKILIMEWELGEINRSVLRNMHIIYLAKGLLEFYYNSYTKANEFFNLVSKYMGNVDSKEKYYTIVYNMLYKLKISDVRSVKNLLKILTGYRNVNEVTIENVFLPIEALINFIEEDYDLASEKAKIYLQNSKERSYFFLIGLGIIISILYMRKDFKNFDYLIEIFFKTATSKELQMPIIDGANDVFKVPLDYIKSKNLYNEFTNKLSKIHLDKQSTLKGGSLLKINHFGSGRVLCNNEKIKWRTLKAENLFLLYALNVQKGVERALILETFWGHMPLTQAQQNLRTTNNYIRNTLKKYNIKGKLTLINDKYVLSLSEYLDDYEQFLENLKLLKKASSAEKRLSYLDVLLEITKEELWSGMTIDYIEQIRERIRQEMTDVILQTIADLIKQDNRVKADRYLNSLKKINPKERYYNIEKIIYGT